MRPENRPISRQVIKIIHDNGDEKIDDLFLARCNKKFRKVAEINKKSN